MEDETEEEEQQRIRNAAMKFIGTIAGNDSDRAENTSTAIRRRIQRKLRHGPDRP